MTPRLVSLGLLLAACSPEPPEADPPAAPASAPVNASADEDHAAHHASVTGKSSPDAPQGTVIARSAVLAAPEAHRTASMGRALLHRDEDGIIVGY